ncbi:MAG: hypothetical protein E4H14_12980 [Candidatus Thorarchaeota archaeon]|nr:MAG: hypothetical protein E4H14_12980 [Candidatus Thorarchaeota archaeon]
MIKINRTGYRIICVDTLQTLTECVSFSIVNFCQPFELSGILAVVFDLVFLEPYFSSHRALWIWDSVEDGYFKFVPTE